MSELIKDFGRLSPAKQKLLLRRLKAQSEKAGRGGDSDTISVSPRREASGLFPLSFAQQRLWFLAQLEPGLPNYHLPTALRLSGPLDVAVLERSLAEITRRHESLRTVFETVDEEPVQRILPPASDWRLPQVDLSGLARDRREDEARSLAAEEGRRPFDVERGPHLRATLLRLAEGTEHALLFTMHHVVSDGWSMGVLVSEVSALYAAYAAGVESPLPELPIQYPDFADWQRGWLTGEVLERQLAYWRERLGGAPTALELPADRPRPPIQTFRGGHLGSLLPKRLADELQRVGGVREREGDTLFMTLLAAFGALLGRYAGQDDVLIGSPIANRNRYELEGLIGFFVNTLVLRVELAGDPTFRELQGRVRETTLGAYAHQDLPFEKLVEELKPERDLSRTPLFQVMLVLQNTAMPDAASAGQPDAGLSDLAIAPLEASDSTAKFDLSISASETPHGLQVGLEYATDLFDETTARRLLGHFHTLLAAVAGDPGLRVSALPLLSPAEAHQIRAEWNDTRTSYPEDACLHELFEAQAERTPEEPAVIFEGRWLSYSDLAERTSRVARRLRDLGAGPDRVVAVCLERSDDLVVALLAVLRSGAAYLPLDPEYPRERLSYMLEDSGAAVLLGREAFLEELPTHGAQILRWEEASSDALLDGPSGARPENLAYVIYTSGSTGRPKGVMNRHRGIVNRLLWMQEAFGLTPADRVLQKTPAGFDVSVWEFFWPLITGAALVVARPGGHREPRYLADLIAAESVTTVHFVPSMLQAFVEEPDSERCVSLVRVIASGEALPHDLVQRFAARLPAPVYNLYGPTEAAVDVTWWAAEPGATRLVSAGVPIGRPIGNLHIHLLDRELRPVPIGVAGELYIGGARGVGLARGYIGRPDLTAERFVPDPLAEADEGNRLYRTGDLARRLPSGAVEFLGRLDHQVKVRGFRIELGEIEAALLRHPTVREAAVVARPASAAAPGDLRLVAYVTPADGPAPLPYALRGSLRDQLPDFMVPTAWVVLLEMPLTASGKLDRKALPAPEGNTLGSSGFVGPRTPTEELLAEIWSEVLEREPISVNDDFFDLGGHSLLATRVFSRIRQTFGVELRLRDVFELPTVAQLSRRIETARTGREQIPLVPVSRSEPLPLSFGQQRLWFLAQLEPDRPVYNMFIPLRLSGRLEVGVLERALHTVVMRHEVLRTTFPESPVVPGEPAQAVWPEPVGDLWRIDLSALPPVMRRDEALRIAAAESLLPFGMEYGPLLRTTLVRLDETREHALLITMHHAVSDGWSLGILVHEVATLYAAFAAGRPSPLPPLSIQYADYAVWQRTWLQGEVLEEQLGYWRGALAGLPAVLDLATDRPRPAVLGSAGDSEGLDLGAAETAAIRHLGRREGSTLYMTLLAALAVLLQRQGGGNDITVGSPVANRNRPEVEGLIGYFANTLVLRSDLAGDPTFAELLARVREASLGSYAHQDIPFEKLVEELRPERSLSHTPLFQVMLVLQNTPSPDLSFSELTLDTFSVGTRTANFDLSLSVTEYEDELYSGLTYRTDLFDPTTVRRMLDRFGTLLAAAAAEPGRRLSELPLLTGAERQQLLEWNDTGDVVPQTVALHQLFEAQAARTPDRPALLAGDESLTYAELDGRAAALAGRILATPAGDNPERIVAVCAERSADLVVAILAVLKAGAAYLPLDPAYPRERLAFMVDDAGADLLLTQERLGEVLADHPIPRLLVGGDSPARPAVAMQAEPGRLAYLIYTSGSTGRPKGVAIEHRSAAAMVHWARGVFDDEELSGVLASTSVCFDLSVFEIFVPLSWGGRVVVVRDALALLDLPESTGVTLVNTVPSALDALLRSRGLPASVRTVNLAGEPIARELVERTEGLPNVRRMLNLYGPSEDTTYSTWASLFGDTPGRPVPIGWPVAGTRAHLLDADSNLVPPGVPGHLHLAGEGLARGYFRRPELTAERFIPDPFTGDDGWQAGDRMYRTGDLARRRTDGTLEFLGRIDHQVKVRGFRIELGEVEAALSRRPELREAAAAVREIGSGAQGDRRLVGYVVPADGIPSDEEIEPEKRETLIAALRAALRETLPDPMIPSVWSVLAALPRNANGKLDRKALPAISADGTRTAGRAAAWAAPVTEVERALVEIWKEVLAVERVGIRDNFFDLGGHSLLLVRVHDRLRKELAPDLPLIDLFRFPDIASLSRHITGGEDRPASAPLRTATLVRPATSPDVAIVGLAGRFPQAASVDELWRNLREGVECITTFSRDELLAAGLPADLVDHPDYVASRGLLAGADLFDAGFFEVNPREAQLTDPQHRLFLESAEVALESAGYAPGWEGRVGVFAGTGLSSYGMNNLFFNGEVTASNPGLALMVGNDKDFIATRVAYKLNLRGPAMTVQSACSTSLLAVHTACRSLLAGECEMALAGGVSVRFPQTSGQLWQEGGISSPDGHTRAFDAAARGTVTGDGVGVVVLKPLAAALADGDTIHAVIRGSGINNDGAGKVGFTAPSIEGQARAIAEAQAIAGVEPESIQYVECHGTATPLGDPIEVAALNQAFGRARGPRTCALGSVKTNVGHLDAAAGVTGLIKAVLALKNGEVPPSLNFEKPNPQIDFAAGPFYVNTALAPWPDTHGGPRRAGVSSFGLGGTNVHVVIEQAPSREIPKETETAPQLLVLSARSEAALEHATDDLARYLEASDEETTDIAWTLQTGRRALDYRRAVVGSAADASEALASRDPRRVLTGLRAAGDRPVAFLFSGLGEQYPGMGRDLYRSEPVFRAELDRCADLLHPHIDLDLRTVLFPKEEAAGEKPAAGPDLRRMLGRGPSRAEGDLARTALAQPAMFAIEYALAKLWMSWGLKPQAMIGYSLGEYVAACLSGVLSLEDALLLVAERARWIEELPAGAMLAVALPEAELLPLLGDELSIAAVNGPRLAVASGPPEAIAALEKHLEAEEIPARRIETSHAFHSRMMLPAVERLTELAGRVERHAPRIPYLSNVTGSWMTAAQAADPGYWARHMCETVRFSDGVAELWREPARVLLEVGPGASLTSLALQHPASSSSGDHVAVSSLPSAFERQPDRDALLHSLAKLWLAGAEVDWRGHHGEAKRRRVPLPAYPFERQRFWIDPPRLFGSAGGPAQVWKPAPPLAPLAAGELSDDLGKIAARWLVLSPGEAQGLGSRIAKRLRQEGLDARVVTLGDAFSLHGSNGDRAYTVSPGRRADWSALIDDLGEIPRRVIHLWGLSPAETIEPADDFARLERAQELAGSFLPLFRELGERSAGTEVRVLIAADRLFRLDAGEAVPVEKASLKDALKATAERYPHLRLRAVDLRAPQQEKDAWESALVDHLLAELVRDHAEPSAAYRGEERWLQAPAAPEPAAALAQEAATPLPAPVGTLHGRPNLRNAYVPPETGLERSLAAMWQVLLGIESVGRHDSFFEMGGHSLLATQLMAQIRKSVGVNLPIASLFDTPTVAELAGAVERRLAEGEGGAAEEETGVPLPAVAPDPAHRFEPFPLTDIQQAYWLGRGAAFELGNIGAHIYWELDYTNLDLTRMNLSLRRTIDRHEMLRAVFLPDGRQRILAEVPPYTIAAIDLAGLSPEGVQAELAGVRQQMSHQVLKPERWPLFEMRAARMDSRRTRIFLSIDVLIGDGFSFGLIGADLARFYAEPEAVVPPFELSFRDYVVAEAALQETSAYARSLAYWQERLATLPPAPELPMVIAPAALEKPHFRRWTARLEARLWKQLKARGARSGLTPSGLLLAAFSEILAAWSKSPRFTITLTLFNRLPVHPEVEQIVGDFTSLTMLGVDASGDGGFEERARAVQERLWQDLEHRIVSGVRVIRELGRIQGRQTAGAMPVVFTSAINTTGTDAPDEEPAPEPAAVEVGDAPDRASGALAMLEEQDWRGATSEFVYAISQTPQVWIDHQVTEVAGALSFNWDVVEELFPSGMIDDMFATYRELLQRLATDETAWTSSRRRLIPSGHLAKRVSVNATGAALSDEYLHTLFAARAALQPEATAVISPNRTLTYGELLGHSNRLGRILRDWGVRPNTLVAVVQEKGWEQVASVLGILAAGAAYLPIEPGLPQERINYLLERGEVEVVLTQSWVEERLTFPKHLRALLVDRAVDGDDWTKIDGSPLAPVQSVNDLAYVIFTSGSTGLPKGVMIDHRGAVNTVLDVNERFGVGPEDRVLALSSLSFDLSVYDIFGLLAAGGAIVMPRADAARDPMHWTERVAAERITIWNSVPALMKLLVDNLEVAGLAVAGNGNGSGAGRSIPLRLVMMSGDWIPLDLPDRIHAMGGEGIQVMSLGGATEASIWSILFPIERLDPSWKSVPYGRPMVNQTFHVLDDRLEPRPDWVPGNLFIGGIGLAKGYWRDAEKTAASFIVHPETGERLYRTGDLGRYFSGGDIEFLGREDFQVKIQGYRIELGEIEAALADHPAVRSAVVAAIGEQMGNKRLVAYVVPAPEETARPDLKEDLRAYLRERLPEYMVPAVFVTLTALPLGPNGKVDRRALPTPEKALLEAGKEFVPPRNDTERTLAGIWIELLRVQQVGVQDNFYELGGDSLLATQVMSRVREAFKVELPLQTFFEAPTLETLAEAVERTAPADTSEADALAALVAQLQDIPPEEVERMLAQLKGQEGGELGG